VPNFFEVTCNSGFIVSIFKYNLGIFSQRCLQHIFIDYFYYRRRKNSVPNIYIYVLLKGSLIQKLTIYPSFQYKSALFIPQR
jgi:hypothetical protein